MKWCNPAALVLLTLILGTATPADATQRHRWWHSAELRAELGLTEAQSAALQAIFQKAVPDLRRLAQEFSQEEDELSMLIDAMEADEWEATLQIDKVEAARSALGKTRALMLYRMHRELSAPQRDALRDWSDRNGRHQRRSPQSR